MKTSTKFNDVKALVGIQPSKPEHGCRNTLEGTSSDGRSTDTVVGVDTDTAADSARIASSASTASSAATASQPCGAAGSAAITTSIKGLSEMVTVLPHTTGKTEETFYGEYLARYDVACQQENRVLCCQYRENGMPHSVTRKPVTVYRTSIEKTKSIPHRTA